MKKVTLISFFLTLALASPVGAADFRTDVTSEYTVSPGNQPKVQVDYALTNSNAAVFVQNYQIVLPGSATSIVVQPKQQQITKDQHADHDRQILDLTFDNEVVGQGKKRGFAVEYADPALRQRRGGAQLIRIPALSGHEEFDSYKTIVRLPESYGTPDYLSPEPVKTGTGSGQLVYTFDQSAGERIDIGFGKRQVLQFEMQQTLANRTNAPTYQSVTFPGDRDGLQFVFSHLLPEPSHWREREDGSWQGIYLLDIGQTETISAGGYVIYDRIDRDFHIQDFYPQLRESLQTWELGTIPEQFAEATGGASVSVSIAHAGAWPLLDRYQINVRQHAGIIRPGVRLQLAVTPGDVTVDPNQHELTLYPWQKSVIISKIRGSWWRPYSRWRLTATLVDAQGKTLDEQTISGLSVSYLALAGLGGLSGLAGVAGSLLVDGRRGKSHLRRQGKKSA